MTRLDDQLQRLFVAYRRACPDVEPSATFMPDLWERIESRRRFALEFRRWARGLITAAAAACLVLASFVYTPASSEPTFYSATYLETLQEDQSAIVDYNAAVGAEVFAPQEPR